jgi:pyruvate/2-oxoglutarate/acetoin dehydrogenase E1 component
MSTRLEPESTNVVEAAGTFVELTYREAIRAALEHELQEDPTVLLMGEDVATAGGVFKTNEGLPEKFGRERIFNTPICENGFIGVALGMAVTGMRPVVEIMFSDFLPTAADAIVNELPKFRFMSGGQCSVPLTVRSIGGATGRFGTQHSATGESWYMALPGLKVATAATPASAYGVLRAAIRDENPVLFFEHKGLYGRKGPVQPNQDGILPVGKAGVLRTGKDVTVLSTMLMADRALAAADRLTEDGISPPRLRHDHRKRLQDGQAARGRGAGTCRRLGRDRHRRADDARRADGAAGDAEPPGRPADRLQPAARGRDPAERGQHRGANSRDGGRLRRTPAIPPGPPTAPACGGRSGSWDGSRHPRPGAGQASPPAVAAWP